MNDASQLLEKIRADLQEPLLDNELLIEIYNLHQQSQYKTEKNTTTKIRALIEEWLNKKHGG